MNAYTSSITIERAPDDVFEFVRVPENQPQWAVNFVRSTRPLGDGRYVMETPAGDLVYRLDADPKRRVVDFVFEPPGGVLPARVIGAGDASVFTFTITRSPGMPDAAWEQGCRGLDEELVVLKRILES